MNWEATAASLVQWPHRDVVSGFGDASPAPFLPIEFRTTLTTLGTPHDITLQELRVESFFPADEATEAASRALAAGGARRRRRPAAPAPAVYRMFPVWPSE